MANERTIDSLDNVSNHSYSLLMNGCAHVRSSSWSVKAMSSVVTSLS